MKTKIQRVDPYRPLKVELTFEDDDEIREFIEVYQDSDICNPKIKTFCEDLERYLQILKRQ